MGVSSDGIFFWKIDLPALKTSGMQFGLNWKKSIKLVDVDKSLGAGGGGWRRVEAGDYQR